MSEITLTNPSIQSLTFHSGTQFIVKFTCDGRIEINPEYQADEAAREFWKCVVKLAPEFFNHDSSTFERWVNK